MSTLTAALIIASTLAVGVPAAWWQIRAAAREESQKDCFIREACTPGLTVWDDRADRWRTLPPGVKPGPGQYTDREVASLDEITVAWDAPAYDPSTDPQWAARRARLLDHRTQKGDQA